MRLPNFQRAVLLASCLMLTGLTSLLMYAAWWGMRYGGADWNTCVIPVSFNTVHEGPFELFVALPFAAALGLLGARIVWRMR